MTQTETNIRLISLVITLTVAVFRISALRTPQQRPVWFALFVLAMCHVLLQAPVAAWVDATAGVRNVAAVLTGLLLVVFDASILALAISASRSGATSPRWRRMRWAFLALTLCLMIVPFTVAAVEGMPTRARYLPQTGSFTVVTVYWLAYLSYRLIANGWAAFLFWRMIGQVRSWLLRAAILLLALGTCTTLLYLGSRVFAVVSADPVFITFGWITSAILLPLLALGCSIAALDPLLRSAVNWYHLRRLYGLWRDLCMAAPGIALQAPSGRLLDMLTFRNSSFRLHRRMIEIRDGLLLFRGWVTPSDLERIRDVVAAAGLPADRVEATVTACWLHIAIEARSRGAAGGGESLDLIRHGGSDTHSELRWLRAVAAEWPSPIAARATGVDFEMAGSGADRL